MSKKTPENPQNQDRDQFGPTDSLRQIGEIVAGIVQNYPDFTGRGRVELDGGAL